MLLPPASHRAVEAFLADILALTGASGGVIRARSPEWDDVGLVAAVGLDEAALYHETLAPICGACAETLANDCITTGSDNCPIARGELTPKGGQAERSLISVPIDLHTQPIGVLTLFFASPPTAPQWEPLLRPLGLLLGLALENVRLEQEQARHWAMRLQHLVAAELHDGLAQRLTYARMTLHLVEQHLQGLAPDLERSDRTPLTAALEKLGALDQTLKVAQQEVRRLIREFGTPDATGDFDWDGLFREFQSACPDVHLQVALNPRQITSPPLVCEQLYRIVEESLHNIRKHAQARHVAITLSPTSQGLQLTIRDDGKGFAAPSPSSFGLKLMKERVALLNGTLTIESSPGKGTTLQVTIPNPLSGVHA